MSIVDKLRKEIHLNMEEEVYEPWPEIGTKAWFQRYVQSIVNYDNDKPRMSSEKLEETFQSLNKFDPKFADLCKKAHDTAIDLMDYAQKRMENK